MSKILPVPKIVKLLSRYIKKSDKVIDIGCGAGAYRYATKGDYIGIDITDAPYRDGIPRQVDIVASADAIPLERDSIDVVFTVSTFYLLPDKTGSLKEFYRILKPGGRVILVDYNSKTQKYLQSIENIKYPCWTQWDLKKLVIDAGFTETEILLPLEWCLPKAFHNLIVNYNETRQGGRAIVTGIKK